MQRLGGALAEPNEPSLTLSCTSFNSMRSIDGLIGTIITAFIQRSTIAPLTRCIKIVSPLSQKQHTLDRGIRVKLSELKFPSELSNHLGLLRDAISHFKYFLMLKRFRSDLSDSVISPIAP